ncbi:MAG: recombinase family protein [Acidobacteria bacterium]|nr:recombinase family protein [Acidobacteriota bacterium]
MGVDALYFRVSSERQTTENQFEDLLQIAQRDNSDRDWPTIRLLLSDCVVEEQRRSSTGALRTVYRVVPSIAAQLAEYCVYVEQGRSGRVGAKQRPLFRQMRRDAALRKFDRLLVWKVSRLGRNMREVLDAVHELAEQGVTVFPIKSQVGPVTSAMGKLLWAINAWFAEMENEERSEAVLAGQARAREEGKVLGRPRVIFRREEVVRLKDSEKLSWSQIAARLGASVGTVRRVYKGSTPGTAPCQNYVERAV